MWLECHGIEGHVGVADRHQAGELPSGLDYWDGTHRRCGGLTFGGIDQFT
jgi:hypothetical protein